MSAGQDLESVSGLAPAAGPPQKHSKIFVFFNSLYHWLLCAAYFFPVCSFLVFLSIFLDPRKTVRSQKALCRNTMRFAGAQVESRRAPGFDSAKTYFFIVNHVNLFDPFVLFLAIPQYVRGLELESHFKIPAYGWMMKRFGNIPVPVKNTPSDLKKMWRLTRAALESGTSLVVFAEGQRTVTGRLGEFKDGAFRMAQQFGCPIVPVSVVGSFEFNNKLGWGLHPGKIVVHLHEPIETAGLKKEDVPALRERVHGIMAGTIDEYYENLQA
jgi:1-acyl-sn-glycerol-3-phosphate acyltransferase